MRVEEWQNGVLVNSYDVPDPEQTPSAEERLASLVAALADAQSLEEIRDAAAAAGGN